MQTAIIILDDVQIRLSKIPFGCSQNKAKGEDTL